MTTKTGFAIISIAALGALLLGACGAIAPAQPRPAPFAPQFPDGMMGGMTGSGMMHGGYGLGGVYDTDSPAPDTEAAVPIDGEIQLTTVNNRFVPGWIAVEPGETVQLVLTNADGAIPHNLYSEEAGMPYLLLPGGETNIMTWTAPTESGAYTAVCTFHPGMNLRITVAA